VIPDGFPVEPFLTADVDQAIALCSGYGFGHALLRGMISKTPAFPGRFFGKHPDAVVCGTAQFRTEQTLDPLFPVGHQPGHFLSPLESTKPPRRGRVFQETVATVKSRDYESDTVNPNSYKRSRHHRHTCLCRDFAAPPARPIRHGACRAAPAMHS
jgi:hypothetical protein